MKFIIRLPSVLLITFLVSVLSAQQLTVIDQVVAKVDDQIVLESEIQQGYDQFVASGQIFKTNVRCKVLEALLVNKLLLAKSVTDSVTVDESSIDGELNRRIQAVLQGRDPKVLEQQYGKSINTIKDEIRDQIRDELITQKMRREVVSTTSITPTEVKKFFKSLPKDSLPFLSAEVQVGHIVVQTTVNNSEKKRIKNKLEAIKKRILKGESFGELAKIYSEDPGSGQLGGELGFFGRGDLVPEYEAAVLNVEEGEMTEVVESQFGFHLIQLIARKGNRFNSRHILMKASSLSSDFEQTSVFLDSVRASILEGNVTFEKQASLNSIDAVTSVSGGFFTDRSTGSTNIQMQNLDPSLFFIIDTMKVGTITQPVAFQTRDGKSAMRIVYYKSKTPPHEMNLTDDYQKIQNAALEAKKAKQLNDWFLSSQKDIYLYVDDKYKKCNVFGRKF
ncbi:MAG: peptidylprolyl isomerase [Cyclobacteriaceae bacterium]